MPMPATTRAAEACQRFWTRPRSPAAAAHKSVATPAIVVRRYRSPSRPRGRAARATITPVRAPTTPTAAVLMPSDSRISGANTTNITPSTLSSTCRPASTPTVAPPPVARTARSDPGS
nr:hypothetical protein [Lentzea albida]